MNFFTGENADRFGAQTLGVRSEHMTLDPEGPWHATVAAIENLGSDCFVYVDLDDGTPVVIRLDARPSLSTGAMVRLSPLQGRMHRFNANGQPITGV